MKKNITMTLIFLFFCALFVSPQNVHAATRSLKVSNSESLSVSVSAGDTGTITPRKNEAEHLSLTYTTSTPDFIKVAKKSGSYRTLAPGNAVISVEGQNDAGEIVFTASVSFQIKLSLKNVTLAKNSVKVKIYPSFYTGTNTATDVYYSSSSFQIKVKSPFVLDAASQGFAVTCTSSNQKVSANTSLSSNRLYVTISASGKCTTTLTIKIANKKYKLKVSCTAVRINDNSYLLEEGRTKQLNIYGTSEKVTWRSSNKAVATVSSTGIVSSKKVGNAVITAKVGTHYLGCAISVVSGTLKAVCERGSYIGTHWTYDQSKRTLDGYYDCSALVWKAYNQYANITFGTPSYPGTTKTESAWCRDHGKLIAGGFSESKITNMKLRPGDIVFKSSNPSDPYGTVYHVEMFTGYLCCGYSNGKPIFYSLWAARNPGYGAEEGSLLARPM